jgi:hypothetical protein
VHAAFIRRIRPWAFAILITSSSLASAIFAEFSHRTKNPTTRSERTYRCRRTRRFGLMCAEQSACVRRRSWAGYTINMFEFEFPQGQVFANEEISAEKFAQSK